MDTSEFHAGPSDTSMPQALEGSAVPPSGVSRVVPLSIAVTPFNSHPQTPAAMEVVAKMRATCPSLERKAPSTPSPRLAAPTVSEGDLQQALSSAAASLSRTTSEVVRDGSPTAQVQPTSVGAAPPSLDCRPARGRPNTLARVSPAAARRMASSPSPRVATPSPPPPMVAALAIGAAQTIVEAGVDGALAALGTLHGDSGAGSPGVVVGRSVVEVQGHAPCTNGM